MYKKILLWMIGCILIMITIVLLIGCNKYSNPAKLYKDIQDKIYKDQMVYIINEGNYIYGVEQEEKKTTDNIIIANTLNKSCYEYNTNTIVNSMCVSKKNIYYINTIHEGNNVSVITKIPKSYKSKEDNSLIQSVKVSNIVLGHITFYKGRLYAFGFDYGNKGVYSRLYVYDENNLDLLKEIDFGDYIIDVMRTDFYGNKIYITGRSARKTQGGEYVEVPNHNICELDVKDYTIRKIYSKYITRDIMCTKKGIYVTNYDEVLDEGNKVLFISYEEGYKNEITFSEKVSDEKYLIRARNKCEKKM